MKPDEQKNEDKQVSYTLVAINVTLLLCLISFGVLLYQSRTTTHIEHIAQANTQADQAAFAQVSLSAKSAVVWDPTTNTVLYAKDSDTTRPLASLTKIMTAVTALSILPENSKVTIPPQALSVEGDSGLLSNEIWSLQNLLNFSLTVSSNDGAASIAAAAGAFNVSSTKDLSATAINAVSASTSIDYTTSVADFVSDMNTEAGKLGLSTLHFNNPTGLDQTDGTNGGQGSALDLAKLFVYAFKNYPDIFADTTHVKDVVSSLQDKHTALNTDLAVSDIAGIIAGKTGTTDLAGANLTVMFDAGLDHPIVIVVLGSTDQGRFQDVEALASSTLAYVHGE